MDCNKQNSGCCKAEVGRGCTFCNCSPEAEATLCDGCFKLHETPWLEEYPETTPTDIFEVRFKNTRRAFFQNANNLPLKRGDIVAVESSPGHDIGIISLTGDLVVKQMHRTGFNPFNGEFKKIYRKAKPFDIERWQESIALEHETMILARQIAADMGLNMKIGDVEYQGDKIKAIFYYIADERVDFRELIKIFAERFHIRIEMKQIGARQEAGRIGGLGACGRELCCASWISSFTSVTTGAARVQDISPNPQKLAGQCSKLKCCMMYEYDTYVDARKELPRLREPLQTLDGEFHLFKSDALAGTMLFSSSKDSLSNAVMLPIARVKEIMALNRAGKKVDRLLEIDTTVTSAEEPTYRSEEDSITRFDESKRRNNRRGGRDRNAGDERGNSTENRPRNNGGNNNKESQDITSTEAQAPREPRQEGRGNRDNRANREGRDNRGNREGRDNRSNGGQNGGGNREGRDNRNNRPQRTEGSTRTNGGNGAENSNTTPTEGATPNNGERRNNNRPQRTEGSTRTNGGNGAENSNTAPVEGATPNNGERRDNNRRGGRNRNRGRGNSGGDGRSNENSENRRSEGGSSENSGRSNDGGEKKE